MHAFLNSITWDQYIITFNVLLFLLCIYCCFDVLALSLLDMWIIFIFLFVLPHQQFKDTETTTTQKHCKTVVDMAQIPGRIEISKNIFLVINKNESWKMLWDYRKWQEIHQYLRKYHSYHIWLALKSTSLPTANQMKIKWNLKLSKEIYAQL